VFFKYKTILDSNNCVNAINKAIRIMHMQRSKTSLDYIITNESVLEVTPEVINCQISDYDVIFAI